MITPQTELAELIASIDDQMADLASSRRAMRAQLAALNERGLLQPDYQAGGISAAYPVIAYQSRHAAGPDSL